jgi:hypothetical protein
MQGYKYGDKVDVYGYGYYGHDNDYRNKAYNNIYDKKTGIYHRNNKWDRSNGWGFKEGDIAPKFDPNSHFESPYYNYDGYSWGGNNYWNRMKNGPWKNNNGYNSGGDSAGSNH